MMMIHNASTMAMGDKEEMEKQVEVLASIDETLSNVYQAKTGLSKDKVNQMMDDETWLTSGEALELGFVDEIINKVDAKMAAIYSIKTNKNIMKLKSLFASFLNQDEDVEQEEEAVVEETIDEKDPDEDEDEDDKNENEFVTKDEFNLLLEKLGLLTEALDDMPTKQDVTDAIANIKTGLKRSNGQPVRANNSVTSDPTTGWVDKHARFRAEMKELDVKTRNQ